jgi:hypothetical protein
MTTLKRELGAIAYFFLFFLVVFVVAGLFFEFGFWPVLAWLRGADGYHLPQLDRLYKWAKLIALAVPPCTLIVWVYEKKSSGR